MAPELLLRTPVTDSNVRLKVDVWNAGAMLLHAVRVTKQFSARLCMPLQLHKIPSKERESVQTQLHKKELAEVLKRFPAR